MKKYIQKSYRYFMILIASSLIPYACSTDDLEPTLAQQKSVEGSIVKVSNLYAILKGGLNRLTS